MENQRKRQFHLEWSHSQSQRRSVIHYTWQSMGELSKSSLNGLLKVDIIPMLEKAVRHNRE